MAEHSAGAEAQYAETDEIDLREVVALLLDDWRWVFSIAGVSIVIFVIYAFTATPVFRTNAMVQVESEESGLTGIEELSSMLTGETPTEAEIEIIRSRLVLMEAIEREGLTVVVEPSRFPVVGGALARRYEGEGPAAPWLGLDSFAWGGEVLQIDRLDVERQLEGEPLILEAGASGQYVVLDSGGERLLTGQVGVSSDGPGLSMFVSALEARAGTRFEVTRYHALDALDELLERLAVTERGSQSGIIEISLRGTDPEQIAATVDSIAGIYLRQNVERRSEEAAQTLTFLNDQLPDLKGQLDRAERALNDYRVEKGSVDLDLETQGLLEQLTEVESQLSELELERLEQSRLFTPEHPTMRAIVQQRAELESTRTQLEQQIRDLPEESQEALGLMRDVRVADELYLLLLNRAQELRVVQAGTVGNVRIIDRAFVPREPVRPRKGLVVALGAMIGLMLGIFTVFLRHAFDRAVRDPKVLEQHFGLPVYAIVPHNDLEERIAQRKSEGAQLVALEDPQDPSIESLRSLRTSLEFLFQEADRRVLAIGSAIPSAGKSFISANLGVLIAQMGRRVLLVDADLRRGHMHRRFGLAREPGLAELIAGAVDADTVVRPTGVDNLFVVTGGQVPPNPAELLVSRRFEDALAELASGFDVVLLDAPPVLAASEAMTLAKVAGINLLVVRSGQQNRREIELALDRLAQAGAKPRGFVFNDLVAGSRRYAYAGYRYYRYDTT